MIKGTIIGGEAAVQRFERMPAKLHVELKTGIARATLLVQRHTKQDKLSGQVLKVRTGRLRRSINTKVVDTETRVVGTVGTNVEYAHAHEYGFDGMVGVREHLRISKGYVKEFVGAQHEKVRAHQRHVHLPERSFLRSSLNDLAEPIRNEFTQAVQRSLT